MIPAIDAPKRPALRYYGGKWKLAPWIISYFPAHMNYVEPCGGAASVLLQKPRSPLETYNDLDGGVVNFFRVLRDKSDELIRRIRLTPWSRAEFEFCRTPHGDEVEQARQFFVSGWMSISGMPHEKSTGWRATSFHGESFTPHGFQFEYTKEILQVVADRLSGVQIENNDARYVVQRFGMRPDALVYFDPPYIEETRVATTQYRVECGTDFHSEMAELLRQCPGYVVVSGYACPLYTDLYEQHGWHRVDREAQTNGGNRIESLWLSPMTVESLAMLEQRGLF